MPPVQQLGANMYASLGHHEVVWERALHLLLFISGKSIPMSQGRQLGADMYARLGQHEAVQEALVGGGLSGRAARYAVQHGLQAAPPQPLPVLHPLVV